MDDRSLYDVPAVLDYVAATTGARVNWMGHSLGGMMLYPFLELCPERDRTHPDVRGDGQPGDLGTTCQDGNASRATEACGLLLRGISTGRIARPMMVGRLAWSRAGSTSSTTRPPTSTGAPISRFYGYTLENPGRGALKQLDSPTSEYGRLLSADGRIDYAARLGEITDATLFVAGEAGQHLRRPLDIRTTFRAMGSPTRPSCASAVATATADYGHCDLVWSRNAPDEVFPAVADWLDGRQPVRPRGRPDDAHPPRPRSRLHSPPAQERVDADLRPGLEPIAGPRQVGQRDEPGVGQPWLSQGAPPAAPARRGGPPPGGPGRPAWRRR